MLLQIHPENPNPRYIKTIIECLKDGGIIIYPTDTVYGLGCDIYKAKAVERICKIKNVKPEKSNFSLLFNDFSHLSEFTKQVDNSTFKVMRKVLPGPFTFILEANSNVPKIFKGNKKTIGIRIPDNKICHTIIKELGNPIMSTSIKDEDEIIEYTTDPELIHEKFEHLVDIVIDGGYGNIHPSTVVDCSNGEFEIIRQGAGILDDII